MANPYRGRTGEFTYFITASTYRKKPLLQSERTASLLVDVLYHYRSQGNYLLHEFVVMPNHFHLLITPASGTTLEKAMQLIKGGFSFRRGKELGLTGEMWETSFYDHRARSSAEHAKLRNYIHENPVRRGLCERAEDFPFSSANPKFELDDVPQWLKPPSLKAG
ncbi:MAG TPA: transposase [Terriglobales bacterium]|nr:transposase [Terriglobales bacterium]